MNFKLDEDEFNGRADRWDGKRISVRRAWLVLNLAGGTCLSVALLAGILLAGHEGLVEDSPFIPSDFEDPDDNAREVESGPEQAPQHNPLDNLELRGITVADDEVQFSLYDREQETGFWIGEDETEGEYELVGYDSTGDAIRVRHGGRERSIVLNEGGVGELSAEEIARQDGAVQEHQARVGQEIQSEGLDVVVGGGDSGSRTTVGESDGPGEDSDSRRSRQRSRDRDDEVGPGSEGVRGAPESRDDGPAESAERLQEAAEELRERRALRREQGGTD